VAKNDVQKQFGTSVRAWRTRLGFSQEELAGRAGLHRTYVCDIERGARNVSLKSIEKLARALNIPVPMLFDYDRPSEGTGPTNLQAGMVEILFVEDDPTDVELTARALREAKFANRIHVVRDGAAALEFLFGQREGNNHPPAERPHMILLDLNLPKVSGSEVLRRIKSDSRTRSIPVVVLTSSKFDRDITASKKLGAEAYIVKPVDFESLSRVVSQLSLQWALLKPQPSIA
jgi:CheY-like chemotaxis protein